MELLLQGEEPLSDGATASDEPHRLPPPVLYGYVRVVRGDNERAAALTADLLAFCQTYGFMLGSIFTDWGVHETELVRPGLSLLLDVCRLVDAYGVVVPARAHLSTHTETLATLTRQIQRTSGRLVVVEMTTATDTRGQSGNAASRVSEDTPGNPDDGAKR